MAIAVVLLCKIDDELTSILLDAVNDTSIQETSTITTHPLINGDVVADHMYRDPISISISGTFGSTIKPGVLVNNQILKLTEIQGLFERIKNEGLLCDMVKVQINDDNIQDIRFLQRRNLMLNQISWTEKITTLGYSFGFQEIAFAQTIEYDVAMDDENYPNISDLDVKNFSEVLLDNNQVLAQLIDFMYHEGLMTETFFQSFVKTSENDLMVYGITAGVAAVIGAIAGIVIAILVIGTAGGPYGAIIGAAVAATIVATVIAVWFMKSVIQGLMRISKYKLKPFKKWKPDEIKRFCDLIKAMDDEMKQLNNTIQVRAFNDDKDQEAVLSLNDTYFVYKFRTNNTTGHKYLEITDIDGKTVGGFNDLNSAPTNYGDCKSTNTVYKDKENNIYVNIVYTGEDNESEKARLTNYLLIIAPFKPEDFSEILGNIIKNYLLRK